MCAARTDLSRHMDRQRAGYGIATLYCACIQVRDPAINRQGMLVCPLDRTRMARNEPHGHDRLSVEHDGTVLSQARRAAFADVQPLAQDQPVPKWCDLPVPAPASDQSTLGHAALLAC